MTRWIRWNLSKVAILLLRSTLAYAAPEEPPVELTAPRNFGYMMGDLIEHTITVAAPESYRLETEFLPAPGAFTEWLDVRSLTWNATHEDGEAHYQIKVTYQFFKGVRNAERATIPALPLRFRGGEPLEVRTPEWEFTAMPLIPPQLADENVMIRDSLPPEPIATAPHRNRLLAYLAGALAVLGYFAWARTARVRPSKPFARAHRELKKLRKAPSSADTYHAAVKRLHKALDETAGHTVFAGQLDRFVATRPAFTELREELAGFFALSQSLFFTVPKAPLPPDSPLARLDELCRRCAAAERRRVSQKPPLPNLETPSPSGRGLGEGLGEGWGEGQQRGQVTDSLAVRAPTLLCLANLRSFCDTLRRGR